MIKKHTLYFFVGVVLVLSIISSLVFFNKKELSRESFEDCTQIVGGTPSVSFDEQRGAFGCRIIFPTAEDELLLRYDGKQYISLERGDKKVMQLALTDGSAGDESAATSSLYETGMIDRSFGSLSFGDLNGDGYQDMMVKTWTGAYNEGFDYWIYNKEARSHTKKGSLLGLVNAEFDPSAKTVTSYDKGRGMGDLYTKKVFGLDNGAYVLTEEVSQDFVQGKNDQYKRVTTLYKNGKILSTDTKYFTGGELEKDMNQ